MCEAVWGEHPLRLSGPQWGGMGGDGQGYPGWHNPHIHRGFSHKMPAMCSVGQALAAVMGTGSEWGAEWPHSAVLGCFCL